MVGIWGVDEGASAMTDQPPGPSSAAPFPRNLKLALWAAVAVGGAALLIATAAVVFHPGPAYQASSGPAGTSVSVAQPGAAKAVASLPPVSPAGSGEPAPPTAFKDAAGKDVTLADFKGKVVVMNLWATWCAPCRKEMPTLAALAALENGHPVKVLPVSVDTAAKTEAAKAFIAANAPLDFHQDAGPNLPFALKPVAEGFPTTIIFDKTGRERVRMAGELDWSGPKVRRVIDQLAAE